MSNKQLEDFISKVQNDKKIERQVLDCGSDKSCVSEVGRRHGHKCSPANVGHWQRDHAGALFS